MEDKSTTNKDMIDRSSGLIPYFERERRMDRGVLELERLVLKLKSILCQENVSQTAQESRLRQHELETSSDNINIKHTVVSQDVIDNFEEIVNHSFEDNERNWVSQDETVLITDYSLTSDTCDEPDTAYDSQNDASQTACCSATADKQALVNESSHQCQEEITVGENKSPVTGIDCSTLREVQRHVSHENKFLHQNINKTLLEQSGEFVDPKVSQHNPGQSSILHDEDDGGLMQSSLQDSKLNHISEDLNNNMYMGEEEVVIGNKVVALKMGKENNAAHEIKENHLLKHKHKHKPKVENQESCLSSIQESCDKSNKVDTSSEDADYSSVDSWIGQKLITKSGFCADQKQIAKATHDIGSSRSAVSGRIGSKFSVETGSNSSDRIGSKLNDGTNSNSTSGHWSVSSGGVSTDWTGSAPSDFTGSVPTDQTGSSPINGSGSSPSDWTVSAPTDGTVIRSVPTDWSGSVYTDGTGSAPTDWTGSAPIDGNGSAPLDGTESVPTDWTGSVPIDWTGSAPSNWIGSVPTSETESAPFAGTGSLPTNLTGSVPTDWTGSIPTDQTGSVPINWIGSAPTDWTGSAPIDGTGLALINGTRSAPIDGTESVPNDDTVTGSVPTDWAGSVSTDRTEPAPSDWTGSVPTDQTGSVPINVGGSAPTDWTESAPTDGTESVPINGSRSAPTDWTGSAPTDEAVIRSVPTDWSSSVSTDGTGSAPTYWTGSAPIDGTGSAPIDGIESVPTDWTGSVPSVGTGSVPTPETRSVPIDGTGSIHTDWAGSVPTDLAISVPTNWTGSTPTDGTRSIPTDGTGSVSTDGTGSAPTDGTGSVPTEWTGSVPLDWTGSAPTDGTWLVSTAETRSAPIDGTGPIPTDLTGSVPTNLTGSTPTNGTRSVPTDWTGSVSTDGTGSVPTDGIGSVPTEWTGSVPTVLTGSAPFDGTWSVSTDGTGSSPIDGTGSESTDGTESVHKTWSNYTCSGFAERNGPTCFQCGTNDTLRGYGGSGCLTHSPMKPYMKATVKYGCFKKTVYITCNSKTYLQVGDDNHIVDKHTDSIRSGYANIEAADVNIIDTSTDVEDVVKVDEASITLLHVTRKEVEIISIVTVLINERRIHVEELLNPDIYTDKKPLFIMDFTEDGIHFNFDMDVSGNKRSSLYTQIGLHNTGGIPRQMMSNWTERCWLVPWKLNTILSNHSLPRMQCQIAGPHLTLPQVMPLVRQENNCYLRLIIKISMPLMHSLHEAAQVKAQEIVNKQTSYNYLLERSSLSWNLEQKYLVRKCRVFEQQRFGSKDTVNDAISSNTCASTTMPRVSNCVVDENTGDDANRDMKIFSVIPGNTDFCGSRNHKHRLDVSECMEYFVGNTICNGCSPLHVVRKTIHKDLNTCSKTETLTSKIYQALLDSAYQLVVQTLSSSVSFSSFLDFLDVQVCNVSDPGLFVLRSDNLIEVIEKINDVENSINKLLFVILEDLDLGLGIGIKQIEDIYTNIETSVIHIAIDFTS